MASSASSGSLRRSKKTDRTIVEGAEAAELYQTYGVPAELFESLAADREFAFDWNGYREAMAQHGEVSGKLVHTVMDSSGPIDAIKKSVKESRFVGYETNHCESDVKGIVVGDRLLEDLSELGADEIATIVLDKTPFYGESGGQVGDTGLLTFDDFNIRVVDTQKDGDLILHVCTDLKGRISVGMSVEARVDTDRRDAIRRAHSATHILHYALQKRLGQHAQQQGSKVTDDWLRFDFTNLEPVAADQITTITGDVRQQIDANQAIDWQTVPLEEARAAGAMMLFGEKYPDPVRMVSMGDFSRELCGGTHLSQTGEVGHFEIISEEGVSAGTRRIIALTGDKAREYITQCRTAVQTACDVLSVAEGDLPDAARGLLQDVRELKKALSSSATAAKTPSPATSASSAGARLDDAGIRQCLVETARLLNLPLFDVPDRVKTLLNERTALAEQLEKRADQGSISLEDLTSQSQAVAGVSVVVADVPMANGNLLRQWIDQIRQTSAPCAVLLGTVESKDKVTLVAGVSRDIQDRIHAGNWVKAVAAEVGGGGGGRPDMAQAGGKIPAKLPAALEAARTFAAKHLG